MKSVIIGLFALVLVSAAFGAEKKASKKFVRQYGMAGCGLGSLAFGKGGSQTSAATTNESSGSQLFGITSGTSNCDDSERLNEVASRMDNYVAGNKVALASDIARGNGEALSTLAKIMNCSDTDKLGSALQGNFREVFPTATVTPNDVTDGILTVIIQTSLVDTSCKVRS